MKLDFVAYMQNIAEKLIAIQHKDEAGKVAFFRNSSISTMDEFLQNLTDIKLPCLMINDFISSRIEVNGTGQAFERQTYIFYVIDQVAPGDADEKQKVIDDTAAIIRTILGKMNYDKYEDLEGNFPKINLRNFELGNSLIESFGPVGDNCYGNYCQFSILYPINAEIKYNSTEWL